MADSFRPSSSKCILDSFLTTRTISEHSVTKMAFSDTQVRRKINFVRYLFLSQQHILASRPLLWTKGRHEWSCDPAHLGDRKCIPFHTIGAACSAVSSVIEYLWPHGLKCKYRKSLQLNCHSCSRPCPPACPTHHPACPQHMRRGETATLWPALVFAGCMQINHNMIYLNRFLTFS